MATNKLVKVSFFDTKSYDSDFFDKEIQRMKENKENNFEIEANYIKEKLNLDSIEKAKGSDAICIFVNDKANSEIIDKIKDLGIKIIALRCAGFNNVDLEAAKKNNIEVVRVPAYSPYSVAEHAIGLLLTLNRKIHRAYNRTRDNDFRINGLLGFDLHGKNAGIVGTGKIGAITAKILKGFGMNVLLYNKFPNEELTKEIDAKYVEKDELFKNSDIISLHCPLFPETKHILNKDAFEKMKDGVMIINTSRGELINSKDLIDALKSKKVAGAGLDVYEFESDYFFEDNSEEILTDEYLAQLLLFNNVILTSHQAFFTREALNAISKTTAENLINFFESQEAPNSVIG